MLNCSLLILPEFYSFLLQPSSFASDVTTCYSVVVLDPRYMHGSLFLNKNVSSGCMSFFPALFPHHFGDLNTVDSHSLWFRKVTVKCCTQYAANLENSAVLTGPEKVSFHSNPKKGNAKECSNCCTIALISHASKVMLKILQARLQQYVTYELPDVQAGFRKGRGTRDQIANIHWIIEKAREFQKNICFIDYIKNFDCVDHNKLWKTRKEMGIPDHLTTS